MKHKIPENIRRAVLSEYYRERAAKAGSVKSEAKRQAARRACLLSRNYLRFAARTHPELASEIQAYESSNWAQKAELRGSLVDKLQKLAHGN